MSHRIITLFMRNKIFNCIIKVLALSYNLIENICKILLVIVLLYAAIGIFFFGGKVNTNTRYDVYETHGIFIYD